MIFDQAKMLFKAKKIQSQLKKTEIEANGAEGKITIVFNGELKLINIKIDESLLSPDRKGELERLLKETFVQGMAKAQAVAAEQSREVMKEMGINIPGL